MLLYLKKLLFVFLIMYMCIYIVYMYFFLFIFLGLKYYMMDMIFWYISSFDISPVSLLRSCFYTKCHTKGSYDKAHLLHVCGPLTGHPFP